MQYWLTTRCFNRQTAGPVDASKLPGEEALNVPGKKEGENKLIRNATGAVDVYTWAGGAWMKVGEMTDGVGTGTNAKKTYNGKEWDYVFEVDAAEGAPKLMLPYNANGTRAPLHWDFRTYQTRPQRTHMPPRKGSWRRTIFPQVTSTRSCSSSKNRPQE